MRILIQIAHPAHVHFYKNFIWEMEKKGHQIRIITKNREICIKLLVAYGFDFKIVSEQYVTGFKRIANQLEYEYSTYKAVKSFDPDFITGIGGTTAAHISKITRAKSIIFTDNLLSYDEFITYPFADCIITPITFPKHIGKKHILIDSFKELAYLHPDHFSPDSQIFDYMGINKDEPFVIIRFASFNAAHDIGISGFDSNYKVKLVNELLKYATVYISPAIEIPEELEKYVIKFPLEKIHDAMYFADLVITDSQTMTTEAAVLGTPAVRCNSWVGSKNEMLNFIELEKKYNLIYNFQSPDLAIKKCVELLSNPDNKILFKQKRESLLSDKINFTNFLVWLFENFDDYKGKNMQDLYSKYKNSINKI